MQVPKVEIERGILSTARKYFLSRGFRDTSMRDISDKVGVSVGNLYHYFNDKDDLLCAVVAPIEKAMKEMLNQHLVYNKDSGTEQMLTVQYFETCMKEYIKLINQHKTISKILFFKAHGSSKETFLDDITAYAEKLLMEQFNKMKANNLNLNSEITDFTIHLRAIWIFVVLREMLWYDLSEQQMEAALADYMRVEHLGWSQFLSK